MNSVFNFSLRVLLMLLLLCLFTLPGYGQIAISNVKEIPRLKQGITYVAMKDTASTIAQTYKEVFRYWTCSKVVFIQHKDILEYISPDASFFTIGGFTTTSTFTHMTNSGGTRPGLSYSTTNIYLELWVCDAKQLEKWKNRKKKKDELPESVKKIIGRIELYTDFPTLAFPEKIYDADYDGNGHIRNWGLGYLKIYLQLLMGLLEKGAEHSLYKGSSDTKQLRNLKKQTLYVPDYVLIKFNMFNGDESKRHEEKEILGDYKWPYQLIENEALNKKIMEEQQQIYFLVYVRSSTDKYISVFNSQTGDLIYTKYKPASYNIKDDDLKDLADEIGK